MIVNLVLGSHLRNATNGAVLEAKRNDRFTSKPQAARIAFLFAPHGSTPLRILPEWVGPHSSDSRMLVKYFGDPSMYLNQITPLMKQRGPQLSTGDPCSRSTTPLSVLP